MNPNHNILIGKKLHTAVYSNHGHLLIEKGHVLSCDIIKRLIRNEVELGKIYHYIQREQINNTKLNEQTFKKATQSLKSTFDKVIFVQQQKMSSNLSKQLFKVLETIIINIMTDIISTKEILYSIHTLIDNDEYTYEHSVRVAVLSILTALSLDYHVDDVKKIGLGALLHDIGKATIEKHIIYKSAKLTDKEYETVKKHAQSGYNLIKSNQHLSYMTKQIVRLHHEKLDGSGYPLGLQGIEIPEYVRIVTVCDMFDAMTTQRVYRQKMPDYKVIDILFADSVFKIDKKILTALISNICFYPLGTGVILSDGRKGIVVQTNKSQSLRPTIKVLNRINASSKGEDFINLLENKTLFIEKTWHLKQPKRKDYIMDFPSLLTHSIAL